MKYEFRSNKIFVAGDNAKDPSDFEEYCSKFETVEKQVNLLTGDETLTVKLYLPYKEKRFEIGRDELREIKIFNVLTQQGLTVIEGENDGPLLKTILTDTEENAPIVFKHDKMGFQVIDDKLCFLGNHPVGDFSPLELTSTYKNNSLAPGGSFGAWRKFIMKSVAKKPLLCLITALGVTASVVFFLKEEGIFTDTLLFALIGDSSIGKSTLLEYLAANTAASKKYVHNFSATTNAIPALLRQHPGMITVLDEATYTPSIDWDSLLYTIPDGKEKLKCNAAGELRENEEFSGAVIIASETSVLERTVQNPGQVARIVEFEEKWFGTGDEAGNEAENMRRFVAKNYGWVTPKVAELLLSEGFSKKLCRRYNKYYNHILSLFDKGVKGVERRLIQRMAVIMTAAWVYEKAVRVDIHKDKLLKILIQKLHEIFDDVKSADKTEQLIESLEGFIKKHASRFPAVSALNHKSMRHSNSDIWGYKSNQGNEPCVWIEKKVFQDFVKENTFMGLTTTCRKLEERKRLVRFYGDRYAVYPDAKEYHAKCYCFISNGDATVIDALTALSPAKKTQKELIKAVNNDVYQQDNYDFNITNTKEDLRLGFLRLGAQVFDMALNKPLCKALGFKASDKKIFITIIPDNGVMMLSKYKLVDNSLSLPIEIINQEVWTNADTSAIEEILKLYNINLKTYGRLVLIDIEIKNDHGAVAIINMKNSSCSWQGAICAESPRALDDLNISDFKKNNKISSQLTSLLEDDEED